jgi:hypothetical protein
MICTYQAEYDSLTAHQKDELVWAFDEHKATKVCGLQISNKSKVNDVTHTLKAIENEVHIYIFKIYVFELTCNHPYSCVTSNLTWEWRPCCSPQHGSTDFSLCGVSFATKGVENFFENALKTVKQDFIGEMKGFAIQGVKGLSSTSL